MAVPPEMRNEIVLSTRNIFPRMNPNMSVPKIVNRVKINPSLPACIALVVVIPKPNPMTDIFRSQLVAFLVVSGNGCLMN